LAEDDTILRFEVADLNRVVTRSAADSDLYREILARLDHPINWHVLAVSCFVITDQWTPQRIAEQTGFRRYRSAPVGQLLAAGYELWPTETFVDGVPDPRNHAHYDVIVAMGPSLIPTDLMAPEPGVRRSARTAMRPLFEVLFAEFGPLQDLPTPSSDDDGRSMGEEDT
jgi:hypothetical protein